MIEKTIRKPSEIKIGKYTLEEILNRHVHWIFAECEGWENMKADLRGADLSNTYLRHANLRYADLRHANLYNTDLSDSDLTCADLHKSNLCNTNLHNTILFGTDLSDANLCYANLHNAILHNSNLCDAKNIPYISLACPSEGAFIAWKKIKKYLVKLEIPANAKRSSATSQKCRASEAKVLGIYTLDGKETDLKNILNTNQRPEINYVVGETVYPDFFDENRWNECSHGIHFFVDKQDAIKY